MGRKRNEYTYVVENILAKGFTHGRYLYCLKWRNYKNESWQPVENCEQCPDIVEKFEKAFKIYKERLENKVKTGSATDEEKKKFEDFQSDTWFVEINPDEHLNQEGTNSLNNGEVMEKVKKHRKKRKKDKKTRRKLYVLSSSSSEDESETSSIVKSDHRESQQINNDYESAGSSHTSAFNLSLGNDQRTSPSSIDTESVNDSSPDSKKTKSDQLLRNLQKLSVTRKHELNLSEASSSENEEGVDDTLSTGNRQEMTTNHKDRKTAESLIAKDKEKNNVRYEVSKKSKENGAKENFSEKSKKDNVKENVSKTSKSNTVKDTPKHPKKRVLQDVPLFQDFTPIVNVSHTKSANRSKKKNTKAPIEEKIKEVIKVVAYKPQLDVFHVQYNDGDEEYLDREFTNENYQQQVIHYYENYIVCHSETSRRIALELPRFLNIPGIIIPSCISDLIAQDDPEKLVEPPKSDLSAQNDSPPEQIPEAPHSEIVDHDSEPSDEHLVSVSTIQEERVNKDVEMTHLNEAIKPSYTPDLIVQNNSNQIPMLPISDLIIQSDSSSVTIPEVPDLEIINHCAESNRDDINQLSAPQPPIINNPPSLESICSDNNNNNNSICDSSIQYQSVNGDQEMIQSNEATKPSYESDLVAQNQIHEEPISHLIDQNDCSPGIIPQSPPSDHHLEADHNINQQPAPQLTVIDTIPGPEFVSNGSHTVSDPSIQSQSLDNDVEMTELSGNINTSDDNIPNGDDLDIFSSLDYDSLGENPSQDNMLPRSEIDEIFQSILRDVSHYSTSSIITLPNQVNENSKPILNQRSTEQSVSHSTLEMSTDGSSTSEMELLPEPDPDDRFVIEYSDDEEI